MAEFKAFGAKDSRIADAIAHRMIHSAHQSNQKGESLRKNTDLI